MNHLLRDLAPISDAGWSEIDTEAKRSLAHFLAARKLVDFTGPLGWEAIAVTTGRVTALDEHQGGREAESGTPGVEVRRRRALALVELRAPFTLERELLERIDRGATDADLGPVVEAARRAAHAEDTMVFHGSADGVPGLVDASPHAPVTITDDYERYPQAVALAVARLKDAGIAGPYAIALGPRCYRGVIEATERGGYPILQHVRLILDGPVVWAPAVDGAVVLSQRGGDVELIVGQDMSVGYLDHDATSVRLYLEESIAVRIAGPDAAVHLTYP
jgi:uncharacterized linocin/CFP29 family protein